MFIVTEEPCVKFGGWGFDFLRKIMRSLVNEENY